MPLGEIPSGNSWEDGYPPVFLNIIHVYTAKMSQAEE
jgi:hypothetical protein